MGHGLSFVNGVASMSYRNGKPWHGFGVELTDADSISVISTIGKSALDFMVERVPSGIMLPSGVFLPDDDAMAFVRMDTQTILGTVGNSTHPLQNADAFMPLQPFLDSGLATIETAGALNKGRNVFMVLKMKDGIREIALGDTNERYFTVLNPHNGKGAVSVGLTGIRTVCWNTYQAALSAKSSKFIRVNHSQHVKRNTADVIGAFEGMNESFDKQDEKFRALVGRTNINQKDLKQYIRNVFDIVPKDETGKYTKQSETKLEDILRIHEKNTGIVADMLKAMKDREEIERETHKLLGENLLDTVLNNMDAGKGADIPSTKNTWYNAYNAVTEYITHFQGRSAETRFASNLMGPGAALEKTALETAMVMSGLQSA